MLIKINSITIYSIYRICLRWMKILILTEVASDELTPFRFPLKKMGTGQKVPIIKVDLGG
jgi:hypothetical protein